MKEAEASYKPFHNVQLTLGTCYCARARVSTYAPTTVWTQVQASLLRVLKESLMHARMAYFI